MSRKLHRTLSVAIAATLVAIAGCGGGGGGGSPAASAAAPTTFALDTCAATFVADSAVTYTLTNQQWQKFSGAPIDGFTQCVHGLTTMTSATDVITWNSGVPDNSVLSYPSVVYGKIPGYNTSTTPRLPALVTALPSLKVNGTVQTTCSDTVVRGTTYTCKYDTAFDMYLVDAAGTKNGEVMIFTEMAGQDVTQYPGYIGQYNIGGDTYQVLNRLVTIPDVSNHTSSTWKYLAFVSTTPIQNFINFDIAPFIAFGLDTGGLNHLTNPILATDKLSSVEMGTEVISGVGTTTISNYSIN